MKNSNKIFFVSELEFVVEIPDTLETKLKEIANSTNSTVEDIVKDILKNYTEEAYEDYLLGKIAKERLKDLDQAFEVSLDELNKE